MPGSTVCGGTRHPARRGAAAGWRCLGLARSPGTCAGRSSLFAVLTCGSTRTASGSTTEFCELFLAERVLVGISLDGDRAANDLHRRYANGRSSYDQVLRAVALLRQERYRAMYAGLLATIDIRSDPVAVYRALADLEPPNLDFLLPHGTWDSPPPGARTQPGVTQLRRLADRRVRRMDAGRPPRAGPDVRVDHRDHRYGGVSAHRVARARAERRGGHRDRRHDRAGGLDQGRLRRRARDRPRHLPAPA